MKQERHLNSSFDGSAYIQTIKNFVEDGSA
jgi:hypothetical protein